MKFAIDFDGTIFKWVKFPDVDKPVPGAVEIINYLYGQGHEIYIWTVRHFDLGYKNMVKALEKYNVSYHNINIMPEQKEYSSSPKINADVFIDDKALFTPVIWENDRYYVDWKKVIIELNNQFPELNIPDNLF